MIISFIHYSLPNGRKSIVNSNEIIGELKEKAKFLINDGCVFESEVLRNGMLSLTCEKAIEGDYEVFGHVLKRGTNNNPKFFEIATNELIDTSYDNYLTYKEKLKCLK